MRSDRFDIVTAYHPSPGNRQLESWRFSPVTQDLSSILESRETEALFITSPNRSHFSYLESALRYKKHVFVEKPVVASRAELEAIKGILDAGISTQVMVGHNYRRQPAFRALKEIITTKTLGRPTMTIGHIGHTGGFRFRTNNWRGRRAECAEGPWIMLGLHYVDLLRYLLGEFEEGHGLGLNQVGVLETPESFVCAFRLSGGVLGTLSCSYVSGQQELIEVFFERGRVEVKENTALLAFSAEGNAIPDLSQSFVELGEAASYREELQEFAEAISSGAPIETGLEEGIRSLEVVFDLNESNRAGRVNVRESAP